MVSMKRADDHRLVDARGAGLRARLTRRLPLLFGSQQPPTVNTSYRRGPEGGRFASIALHMPLDDAATLADFLDQLGDAVARVAARPGDTVTLVWRVGPLSLVADATDAKVPPTER